MSVPTTDTVEVEQAQPPKDPPVEPAKAADTTPDKVATEFDPIIPELSAGGTIVVGKTDLQVKGRTAPGVTCRIKPIRIKELLTLGRIMTGQTRPLDIHAMIEPAMTAETEEEQEAAIMAAVVQLSVSIPHSEQEFIGLLVQITDPVDRLEGDEVNAFFTYMKNPDVIDTTQIIAQAIKNEAGQARDLGKALMSMFPRLQTVVATPETEEK